MKKILLVMAFTTLAGCQALPPVKCTAITRIGGQDVNVPIYDVKTEASQTKYFAGNPFGWKWVSKSNFSQSTCQK